MAIKIKSECCGTAAYMAQDYDNPYYVFKCEHCEDQFKVKPLDLADRVKE